MKNHHLLAAFTYSPRWITKEDPTVICPTMPLYQTNNAFCARFDNNNVESGVRAITDPEDWVSSLAEADVRMVKRASSSSSEEE